MGEGLHLSFRVFGTAHPTRPSRPRLDERAPGRLVFVSSGAGAANLSKMAEARGGPENSAGEDPMDEYQVIWWGGFLHD